MTRFVVCLNFLEKGFSNILESLTRAKDFQASAAAMGAKIEFSCWTLGQYDGIFVLSAPDETTAAALVLKLGRDGNVRTTMMRAFDADEFAAIVSKVGL